MNQSVAPESVQQLGRRAFLQNGALILLGTGLSTSFSGKLLANEIEEKSLVHVGLITDMHYADKDANGKRNYRDTQKKLEIAASQFEKTRPTCVIELGDFIDSASSVDQELAFLKRINKEFSQLPGKKHYVLGNHCVESLTKEEFLGEVGQQKSYYSFDENGVHFVILDGCFRKDRAPYGRKNSDWTDANLTEAQIDWLKADLKSAVGPVIVFVHQRLDVENKYAVKEAAMVRKIFEESGKVRAVFQGHNHVNDLKEIGGIHYCTLMAMIEGPVETNNAFSTLDVYQNGSIRLTGFHKQESRKWS
ncbi:metallophosphoesterase family protein [Planctomicrobium sp. SH527]|uniref:metallophosphoesterase family protein n=1 Tax=Planctomicrobium sp. SH527 TaxID=3448123 RepID=UPI003F5B646F